MDLDFRANPLDPQYGTLVRRFVHEIDRGPIKEKRIKSTEQRNYWASKTSTNLVGFNGT